MKSSIVLRLVIALAVALALIVPATFAQAVTGTISGVIKDPNGAVIPGAKVVARNAGTNATATSTTDAAGAYKIINLVSGSYILEVEAKGFRKTTTIPQRLSTADVLRLDLTLELGQVTETVTVEEVATKVNTEDAQMGQVLRDVYQLPIISGAGGRNPLSLAATQPGVVWAPGASATIGPMAVNGQRSQANNFMLDGGDSNDLAINVPDAVQSISPNAISEFRVITGAMKAEFGRNSGAVIQVTTRSGDNKWHGGANEVFRNTKLNAVPFFQKVTPGPVETFTTGLPRKPQWNTNDFDAQFGGPVKKDKTFFFVNYLGFRRRQGVTRSATVFNDAQRSLINQYGTKEAKALLALVPAASTGNTLYSAPTNQATRDQGSAKFDHNFTDANRLSVTYFIEHVDSANPFASTGGSNVPGFGDRGTTRYQNLIIRDTHTFSANVFNEFRASFHRRGTIGVVPQKLWKLKDLGITGVNADDPSAEGAPWVAISGFSAYGNSYQGPQARADNTFQYLDNLNWNKGRHYLKFGGEFRTYAQNQLFTFVNSGYIYIDGGGVANELVNPISGLTDPLSDFASGFATQFVQNNSNRQGYRTRGTSFFAQDDWKVSRTFTLNYGVRWEYNGGLKELADRAISFRPGQQSAIYPTAPKGMVYPGDSGVTRSTYGEDLNNWAPRVGFAWDVFGNGKLSMRAGYGIFYDAPITELTLQFLGVPPYGLQPAIYYTMYRDPYATSYYNPMANPFPFKASRPGDKVDYTAFGTMGFTIMDPGFRTPYGQQGNWQLQYQLAKDWLIEAGYSWSSGVKLLSRREINPGVPGVGSNSGNVDPRRVYNLNNPLNDAFGGAVFGGITLQGSDANSNYNALQAMITKRYSSGLTMTHAYTWGHAIDNASGLRSNIRYNNAAADRGNADHDVRHRYVMTYQYELPVLKDQKGVLGKAFGGWAISGITTFATGQVFNIVEGEDRSLTGAGADRPDYIGGNVVFYDPRGVANVAGKANAYFDGTGGGTGSAATNPFFRRVGSAASWSSGAGRFGNLGRNVFHGPGLNNFDFSIGKRFRISEGHTLEFKTEMFNLWNHVMFSNPIADISSVNFGRITSAQVEPRLIQFNLKYWF